MNKRKVILCEKCEGKGYITKTEEHCIDYHRGIYDYTSTRHKCKYCDGSGRLIEIISYEPFVLPEGIQG